MYYFVRLFTLSFELFRSLLTWIIDSLSLTHSDIHVYTQPCEHTQKHAQSHGHTQHIHNYTDTETHTRVITHRDTQIHTRKYTHTNTHAITKEHAQLQIYKHTHDHTSNHTQWYANNHMCIYKYTHNHTHTNTYANICTIALTHN